MTRLPVFVGEYEWLVAARDGEDTLTLDEWMGRSIFCGFEYEGIDGLQACPCMWKVDGKLVPYSRADSVLVRPIAVWIDDD
jgi:hypothetical protein